MPRLIHDGVSDVLKRWLVESGAAPGASACVGHFGPSGWRVARGVAGTYDRGKGPRVWEGTLYDLASLTKPIVACTTARLSRSNALAWEAPVGRWIDEARGAAAEDCPLDLLASHRAGLEAHRVLGDPAKPAHWDRGRALHVCADALREECVGPRPPEGYPPVYSDLGYVLIGAVIERATRQPLSMAVAREVSGPLSLGVAGANELSLRHADFLERVAPTETLAARGGRIVGVVHDDNAWLLAGRDVAGHAGLFGTADDVAQFGMAVVDALAGRRPDWLTAAEAGALVQPRPGGSLRMGFDGKSERGSSAGARFGESAFGHLGFTGTSLWCDPESEVVVAVLSNRVCPSRQNVKIREVRPDLHGELHDLAADL